MSYLGKGGKKLFSLVNLGAYLLSFVLCGFCMAHRIARFSFDIELQKNDFYLSNNEFCAFTLQEAFMNTQSWMVENILPVTSTVFQKKIEQNLYLPNNRT